MAPRKKDGSTPKVKAVKPKTPKDKKIKIEKIDYSLTDDEESSLEVTDEEVGESKLIDTIISNIENPPPPGPDDNNRNIKALVNGFYDFQLHRIRLGNVLCANFYNKIGIKPGQKVDAKELETIKQVILTKLKTEHKLLADALTQKSIKLGSIQQFNREKFDELIEGAEKRGIISTIAEYKMVTNYLLVRQHEEELKKGFADILTKFRLWNEYLNLIPGIGPTLGAIIVASFDIYKADHVSSFWKFAGIDSVQFREFDGKWDGRARGKYKEHVIKREYTNKEGETKEKDSLTYGPWLHSKLLKVMSECLIKLNTVNHKITVDGERVVVPYLGDAAYGKVYTDYKLRISTQWWRQCIIKRDPTNPTGYTRVYPDKVNNAGEVVGKYCFNDLPPSQNIRNNFLGEIPEHNYARRYLEKNTKKDEYPEFSPGRLTAMAKRYVVRCFLKDLWINWRIMEGLPVMPDGPGYEEAKLGMHHHYRLMISGKMTLVHGESPIHSLIAAQNKKVS